MLKTNYHTHSTFCDGKDTPDQIAQTAISKGFDILGFSSHSMYPFASTWHIAPNSFEDYIKSIQDVKKKYDGRLKILMGFEADYIPGVTEPDFSYYKKLKPDYLIGSVHYVFTEKGRLAVDYSADLLKEKIDELFNGSAKKLTCEYFALERKMLSECSFTILGHPDLIRKNNKALSLFDENESWYRKEIKALADSIKKAGVIAEVNTGAISRGYMDGVYPSDELLSLLCQGHVPVTISSDAHNADNIDSNFDLALSAIKKAGYSELAFIDSDLQVKFQKIQ